MLILMHDLLNLIYMDYIYNVFKYFFFLHADNITFMDGWTKIMRILKVS